MQRTGLFHLQSPQDLLKKANHDLERLRLRPVDAYAAFDFFVTVRHLPDWIYPDDDAKQKLLFQEHRGLRIARHIADGAKHFEVTAKHHFQVAGSSALMSVTQMSEGTEENEVETLIIELDSRDSYPDLLELRITALDLAERVFAEARKMLS